MASKPNILLVHGAWGDGSHWRHVIPALHNKGYRVRAVQNPLTSLPDDIDRTTKLAEAQPGPTLLVGHSYGGAVITGAGHISNVIGLVYVAAFAPDAGEDSAVSERCARHRRVPRVCNPISMVFCGSIRTSFMRAFVKIYEEQALVMALTQKPIAARCFADQSGPPAWKNKPSWYQISANDRMIPPETETFMAERIRPRKTITLQASHASLASQGEAIVSLVEEASTALM